MKILYIMEYNLYYIYYEHSAAFVSDSLACDSLEDILLSLFTMHYVP